MKFVSPHNSHEHHENVKTSSYLFSLLIVKAQKDNLRHDNMGLNALVEQSFIVPA